VPDVPEVLTPRLLLRGWRSGDLGPFARLNADPRVTEHFASALERHESDALVTRIGACWAERGYGLWAVEVRASARFVGYVGLWPAEFAAPFTPAVEVGWRLAPEAWGHGYATEGGRAALQHGFGVLGLAEVVSFTAVANARSRRVMERLGMRRDPAGDFEHPHVDPGHPARAHVLYRLQAVQGVAEKSASASTGASSRSTAVAATTQSASRRHTRVCRVSPG
jgi:RimJ/RimL family protein N-acetyltransferase